MCVLVVDIHFLKTDGFRLSRRHSFVEVMAPLVHLMLADLQMFPGEPWTASTSQLLFRTLDNWMRVLWATRLSVKIGYHLS